MTTDRVLVPALLDLTGLRILFVGAGEGTRIKLTSLVDQNPTVRVVAPKISPEVRRLVARLSDAQVFERALEEADLEGISLVYGLTDDEEVNSHLAELCRRWGVWNNVAHHHGPLSFTSPAVGRKAGILAAFSSEEGKPAVSVAARDSWLEDR